VAEEELSEEDKAVVELVEEGVSVETAAGVYRKIHGLP